MGKEIEHKYLVINDSFREMATKSYAIEQGYLSRVKECVVRIRISDCRGFITIKGKTIGDSRQEFEYEIPLNDARKLLELCNPPIIKKERYIVPYGEETWEVDIFAPPLAPLILAEIELLESRHDYSLPPFVGKEVTDDAKFFNSNLTANIKSDL